ncbi:MAG: uroporphyrinogen-III synthase, partial [Terriglobia bacterium]
LIAHYGGHAVVAPAMREVPLELNPEALEFARALLKGKVDMVIFLTGVGTRILASIAPTVCSRQEFVAALQRIHTVARGPKSASALRELGVSVTLTVPEPNTWHELLSALDENADSLPLKGRRIAVQEYGTSNADLLAGLAQRGAEVLRVPVYQWALPENVGPLEDAIRSICNGEIDVALFTTSLHVTHLLELASRMELEQSLRKAFSRIVTGSIGPTTSEELRRHGLAPDLEPTHPRMGVLVKEAAERSREILRQKQAYLPGAPLSNPE